MINAPKADLPVNSVSADERLSQYLVWRGAAADPLAIQALTPDASTRLYFRIPWPAAPSATAVAAVYPEAFDPEVNPFLDLSRLLNEARIPIPEIYDVDGPRGLIIQEDLGDQQLAGLITQIPDEDRARYFAKAIGIIADIQQATELAYLRDSIASRLAFDEAKLIWELEFFVEHYFRSLRREKLKRSELAELKIELNDVAAELSARPRVLCHRDYHAANLMIDARDEVRVVDYQDARMGPATYDLVSLVLDRRVAPPPPEEIAGYCALFNEERTRRNLGEIEPQEFAGEYALMTVQRCLKAVGTFSNQTANHGRAAAYARFINPMLLIVSAAAEKLGRFPALRRMIEARADQEVPGAN